MVSYLILGFIQGITEFMPVSSSAHLLFAQKLLGIQGNEIALSVVLHLGTVLSVCIFFFKDIIKMMRNLATLKLACITTLITGSFGILGKDFFESLFSFPVAASCALILTGVMLIATKRFLGGARNSITLKDAVIVGLTQGIAIIPGISRSGITVSTLLFRKVDQETSFKFSFLVSIPVILGAALLESRKVGFAFGGQELFFLAGFLASCLSGIFALWVVRLALAKAKFHYFGFYCIFIAVVTLLFLR